MGDITHIYDTNGALKAHYIYDAWGNHKIYDVNGNEVTKSMSDHIGNINPIRYRGYYYDDYENENGLYYLEARYYDPETGRFISQDSIDFLVPNHLTGLNLYACCNNNPIMFTDDSGCLPNWAKWLIGGVAFAGAVALTVISGGSLAPVFVGMAASIAIGGAIDGAISAANGGSFWQGFANGAADGAMWGGIFALGGTGVSFAKNLSLIGSRGVVIGKGMDRVGFVADQPHYPNTVP